MNISQQEDFRDISQVEALAILDRKSSTKAQFFNKPYKQQINHRPKIDNSKVESLKKELTELKSVVLQRNEKIKSLNAEKIALMNQVRALESRLEYFEQFKIKVRHHVGTDEFLKIIEQVGK